METNLNQPRCCQQSRNLAHNNKATDKSEVSTLTIVSAFPSAFNLWNCILAFFCLAVGSSTYAADVFISPECLNRLPVPIEECFAEFLKSGSSDKDVWINFLNRHKGLIYYNQDLRKLQIHAVRPTTEVELSHRPTDSRGSPKEIKLSAKEHRNSKEVPYLSSGGWLNIITLRWGVAGHSDVTEYVLREYFKFFPGARDIDRKSVVEGK